MKSLEEYEREKAESPEDTGSGIACPSCDSELRDEGNLLYPAYPQQKRLTCPDCGFSKVVRA